MITVILIVVGALTVILAPFAPKWVDTARGSFDAIAQQKAMQEASLSPLGAIVPSQIAPWMNTQANTMKNATGPLEWKVVSFRNGPCNPGNLSQLPDSKYSTAIGAACVSLDDIQQRYSGTCFLASNCNIPEAAKEEIAGAMNIVWDAFSDAGFVLPYTEFEQVLP